MKKSNNVFFEFLRGNILPMGMFIAVFLILLYGIQSTKADSRQAHLEMVEESITRSIISCYAIEGQYPESLDYLRERYGLILDDRKYVVHYEIFASNILPEVTITEVGR